MIKNVEGYDAADDFATSVKVHILTDRPKVVRDRSAWRVAQR